MKRLIYILIGVVCLLTSCETNIAEKDRLVYVQPPQVGRKVLIEDFTGQNCVNCPRANDVIHQLQEQYGADTVIAVGIHSGPFGFRGNDTYPVGLATDLGDTYYNHWGIEAQPQGMVNRLGVFNDPEWPAVVRYELERQAPLDIEIKNVYSEADNSVDVTVTSVGTSGAVDGKLQLWIVEDSIVAMQKDGRKTIPDYLHQHVFRDAVNGNWGTDFSIDEGGVKTATFHYTLDPKWVVKNLSIVAFVYNSAGVQQVEIKKVVNQ